MQFDFVATNPSGRPLVVVEAKRLAPTSPDWARQFHRNLLAHGSFDAEWLLIVTPDRAYAFRERDPEASPDVVVDMRSRLKPYFKRLDATPDSISSSTFDHVVAWWLEDLAMGRLEDLELRPSGLGSQLEGATIVRQAA
jgi:hypothetical protein